MSMTWEPLQNGDVVDVIAPSYGVSDDEIKQVRKYIESLGLEANIPKNLTGEHLFCSNTGEYRFLNLKQALESEKSKAVWCVRGGYGAAQLIPMLDDIEKPARPKLFIGFSDITALHIFFNQRWEWPTLHAPVLWQIINGKIEDQSLNELNAVIFGKGKNIILDDLVPLNDAAKEEKQIESSVVGGNLSLIQTSLATSWELDTTGKILLLEDTDEKTYSYDRMLQHLKQAGLIERADAILLGHFQHHKDEDARVDAMLKRFACGVEVPVLQTRLVGHGKVNHPIALGTKAFLELGKKPLVRINVN